MLNHTFKKIRYLAFPLITVLGVLIVIDILAIAGISFYVEQYIGIYLSMVLFGAYISKPYKKGADFTAVDAALAILSLSCGLYLTIFYRSISLSMGVPTAARILFGIVAILLILEALRRSIGLSLTIVCAVFLVYTYFGSHLSGTLHAKQWASLGKMVNYIYINPNCIMYMLKFGAGVGVAFIFFGQILLHYGGGKSFIDFALLFCGRSQGGSAKTAVISSALVGTITGAPMTNVLRTGSVTIPMMKEAGYPPHEAGAVEAVASSGGQIMPPVMGIAAFIMAETLGVSYSRVALAALIPAILFYLATFVQVHMDAGKLHLKLIPEEMLPKPKQALKNGWHIIPPITLLLVLLFGIGYSTSKSAVVAGAAALGFLAIKRVNRIGFFKNFIGALRECGGMIIDIGIVMAGAGLIVGCVNGSGLAFNLSYALTNLGDNNLFLLLVLSAVASLILGMGVPSVAAYSLVATLVAPTVVSFGIPAMAAHLFVFYFAVIANITPPVAVACFAAAPLAGSNPNKVGITAFRLAIAAYVIPFAMCYNPELIMQGAPLNILFTFLLTAYSLFCMCVALSGYWHKKLHILVRLATIMTAIVVLWPTSHLINLAACVVDTMILLPNIRLSVQAGVEKRAKKKISAAGL